MMQCTRIIWWRRLHWLDVDSIVDTTRSTCSGAFGKISGLTSRLGRCVRTSVLIFEEWELTRIDKRICPTRIESTHEICDVIDILRWFFVTDLTDPHSIHFITGSSSFFRLRFGGSVSDPLVHRWSKELQWRGHTRLARPTGHPLSTSRGPGHLRLCWLCSVISPSSPHISTPFRCFPNFSLHVCLKYPNILTCNILEL